MEVNLKLRVESGDVSTAGGPVVVLNLYEGVKTPGGATKAVDGAMGGAISRTLAAGDFKGSLGEVLTLYPAMKGKGIPSRVLVIGLGKKESFDVEAARRVGAVLVQTLRKLKVTSAATVVHGGDSGKPMGDLARGLTEGILLGAYRYDDYFRDGRAEPLALREVVLYEAQAAKLRAIREGVALGERVAGSTNAVRDLVNGPSCLVTPTHLAETAQKLGHRHGFKVTVLDREDCEREGMGSFLGVARGSLEPPKFVVMEYAGRAPKGTVCLVGKGITFDSGGISLKPAQDMDQMKSDMSGAAAVIGAMCYAAEEKVPLKVVGIFAATENMPGGRAYKPGDILTSSAGVTIEVLNTDAEGRLILADALTYARRFAPDAVIDLATLTGACVIALGSHVAGLMGNDEWLLDRVHEASREAGEWAWPLPLWEEHRDLVKSSIADIKNTAGRSAGAITAGAFLGAFTNTYRWVHLDIAGTAWLEKPQGYLAAGGTGAGVRILAEFMRTWKRPPRGKGPEPGPRTSIRSLPPEAKAALDAVVEERMKAGRAAGARAAAPGRRAGKAAKKGAARKRG